MGGKSYGAHHAQRVVTECNIGVERSAYNSFLQVVHAVEGVYQFPPVFPVQANGQRVDCKVAAVLIVLQRAVLDDRFAGVVAIRLFAGAYKFYFDALSPMMIFHLCRAKIAKCREVCPFSQPGGEGFGKFYAAAQSHDVYIFGGAVQKNVAHIPADNEARAVHLVGNFADEPEHGRVQVVEYKLVVGLHSRGD